MNYITDAEFLRELARWERKLPHFDAFVGVPRSGVWPAAWLAMRRNAKLLDLTQLRQGELTTDVQTILVVDDNVSAKTVTFTRLRAELPLWVVKRCEFGTVYRSYAESKVDHYSRHLFPGPVFEYDWHRRHYVRNAGFDMDGVLCEDYHGYEHRTPAEYDDFLRNVKVLYKPRDAVKAIVTARLEKHRDVTEDWLQRNGIRYEELIMYSGTDEQRRVDGCWAHKAEYLKRPDVWFFVESCPEQSKQIAAAAKKPVICPGHSIFGVPARA